MMTTAELRLNLINRIMQMQEEDLLRLQQLADEFEPGHSITLEQYNLELEASEQNIDEGIYFTQEQVEEQVMQWQKEK